MSVDTKLAEETILRIKERAAKQSERNRAKLKELFGRAGREGRKPPEDFGDSSYLYVRSTSADSGARPLPNGTVFWLSPDIRIRPLTGTGSYTTTLEAGKSYMVEVHLRNRGDIPVPSAKVELFLTDPTIGFDTRFATLHGVGSTWVPGVGSGVVTIPFRVPAAESGHKCLIVRAFSFSPMDLPLDDTALSPPVDRHVAQLNINIVASSSAMIVPFQLVHLANFQGQLRFRAATQREILGAGHALFAETEFIETPRLPLQLMRQAGINHVGGGDTHRLTMENDGRVIRLSSEGDGPSLDDQKVHNARMAEALELIGAGKAKPSEFRDLLRERRKFATANVVDRFELKLPQIGVEKGQSMAVHLETVSVFGETVGGITLALTG